MNTADRAIVAAAEERDRETELAWPGTDWVVGALRDRRELLRIIDLLEGELGALQAVMETAEAEFLRPIGGGL